MKGYVEIKILKQEIRQITNICHNHLQIIKQTNDHVNIKVPYNDLSLLNNNNIKYEIINYRGLIKLLLFFQEQFYVLIGIIVFLTILILNTLSIKQITFNTTTKDNNKIEQIINNNLKNIYGLKFLNNDIGEINLVLRKEFSTYEWVSVKRVGSTLHVTILEPSVINKQVENIEGYGDLVASKSGIIKSYKVSHGIVKIEPGQVVKKGDLLVSGNLRINDANQSPFNIPAQGEVFAEVWYTKTVEVAKTSKRSDYTGKIKTEKCLSLFGFDLKYKKNKTNYTDFDIEISESKLKIINFVLPFSIKKIHYLEKNDIINIYDDESSYEYAYSILVSQIKKEFTENDKILKVEVISSSKTDDVYSYNFFVTTYENIAQFQRR